MNLNGKMVAILIGEMGAGKNFHGEQIARMARVPFLDGDEVLPPEMAEMVRRFRPLPTEMIERYVEGPLYDAIVSRMGDTGIVIGQALYRNEHRMKLLKKLVANGFRTQIVWIRAPFWRNLRQLWHRPQGWKWVLYWLLNKPFFQRPTFECQVL